MQRGDVVGHGRARPGLLLLLFLVLVVVLGGLLEQVVADEEEGRAPLVHVVGPVVSSPCVEHHVVDASFLAMDQQNIAERPDGVDDVRVVAAGLKHSFEGVEKDDPEIAPAFLEIGQYSLHTIDCIQELLVLPELARPALQHVKNQPLRMNEKQGGGCQLLHQIHIWLGARGPEISYLVHSFPSYFCDGALVDVGENVVVADV
mmetsp:Transcript_12591/g.30042  ORF Transcript_12591/g.30042 Transcript_12591/m.30042 type:complete len:203 (-) Transcript_12591:86-694(-)